MEEGLAIRSWAEEDRPREKLLLKGRHELSNAELLAILIGSGNRRHNAVDLARFILADLENDLGRLARLGPADLARHRGIGEAKAVKIVAALELARRRLNTRTEDKAQIRCSQDLDAQIRDVLSDRDREEFWVLYLNRANRLIHRERISVGGVSGTVVDVKLIFKAALERLASSLALCHNHPSGNLKPSEADISLTRKVIKAGRVMDIAVLDHLIITDHGYFSFADQGLLEG
jgi:DNA repair protein RadC